MQKMLLILTYLRAVLHWLWLFGVTALTVFFIVLFELFGWKKKSHQASRIWAFFLLWFCGIKVRSKNISHIPTNTAFLMLFNHRSYVDIPALFQATPARFYFGAKKSLFSIPLLGLAMKRAGHIPIQRKDPRTTVKMYGSLKDRINKGDSFALSPEGGRHKGLGLSRFKKGPFWFAINYQIKILPVVIHGAEECMPKGSWFFNKGALKRTVLVEYLPALETKGLNKEDIKHLQNQVYSRMAKALTD